MLARKRASGPSNMQLWGRFSVVYALAWGGGGVGRLNLHVQPRVHSLRLHGLLYRRIAVDTLSAVDLWLHASCPQAQGRLSSRKQTSCAAHVQHPTLAFAFLLDAALDLVTLCGPCS